MSLKDQIADDMKSAMRSRDQHTLEAIRLLRADIQRREVDERVELNDDQVIEVVQKMIKKGRDAVAQFRGAGRDDLADKDEAIIAVVERYLPAALSDEEVDAAIDAAIAETGAASIKDMGKVMGILKASLAGRADMGSVSARIKARLG